VATKAGPILKSCPMNIRPRRSSRLVATKAGPIGQGFFHKQNNIKANRFTNKYLPNELKSQIYEKLQVKDHLY
jgi:hypothetical protein